MEKAKIIIAPEEITQARGLLLMQEKRDQASSVVDVKTLSERMVVAVADLLMVNGEHASMERGDGRHKDAAGRPTGSPVILAIEDANIVDDDNYWRWRRKVALVAQEYRKETRYDAPVPVIDFSEDDQGTWRSVMSQLDRLHDQFGSQILLAGREEMADLINAKAIPNMDEVNREFMRITSGMKLVPVEGLLDPHIFLSSLLAVMHYTNYIRHPQAAEFTPEPDIIHEMGHIRMLLNEEVRALNRVFAETAIKLMEHPDAPNLLQMLGTLYWYSIEYSTIIENGEHKIFGAGNAMGIADAQLSMRKDVERFPFTVENVQQVAGYDYQSRQQAFAFFSHIDEVVEQIRRFAKMHGVDV